MPERPPPPLLPVAELERRARELCQARVESQLEGSYRLEALPPTLEWSPTELRHLFDLPLVVWRAYGSFEVLLDDQDRAVGFVDHDKWLGCAHRELPPGEAERLARATGLVPEGLSLHSAARGEKDCLELLFGGPRQRLRVRVNPARPAVIAVEPQEEAA